MRGSLVCGWFPRLRAMRLKQPEQHFVISSVNPFKQTYPHHAVTLSEGLYLSRLRCCILRSRKHQDKGTNKQTNKTRVNTPQLTHIQSNGNTTCHVSYSSCWGDPVQLINVKIQELTFRFPCGQDQTWYEVVKDNDSWLELKLYKVLKLSLDEMTKSEIIHTTNSAKMHRGFGKNEGELAWQSRKVI